MNDHRSLFYLTFVLCFGLIASAALTAQPKTEPVELEVKLATVTVGRQLEGVITEEKPVAVMEVIVPDEGLFTLNVKGHGVKNSDLGLEISGPDGVRQWDKDNGGDYNNESMLFRKPGTYTVRVKQLNEKFTTVKLDVRLVKVEPSELLVDKTDAHRISQDQSTFYYRIQHDGGSVMQLNLESGKAALAVTILRPDGSIDYREFDSSRGKLSERIVMEKKPRGTYYVEVRRKYRGEGDLSIAFRAFDENYTPTVANGVETHGGKGPDPDSRPIRDGLRLYAGRASQDKLTADAARVRHALTVQAVPLLVEVRGSAGDLKLLIRGPFTYSADFDYQKNQAHELVLLPFPGEYELIVQRMDYGTDALDYRVTVAPMNAETLRPGIVLKHEAGVGKTHLYRMTAVKFPAVVEVEGTDKSPDAGDLMLTTFVRQADGRIQAANIDSDMNGFANYERFTQEEAGEVLIFVRQGTGRLESIPYRIHVTEKPAEAEKAVDAKSKDAKSAQPEKKR